MKVFDLEKSDSQYHFKVWDRDVHEWKHLAKAAGWKLTIVKEPGLVVMRHLQIAAKNRQAFEEIGYALTELPGVEFEGGARLKKRPPKAKRKA